MKDAGTFETLPAGETWQEITGLVDELAELVKTELPPSRFHAELLERLTRATAAVAGAIWVCDQGPELRLDHQICLDKVLDARNPDVGDRHLALVRRACGEALHAAPGAAIAEGAPENPSGHVALLAPILVDNEPQGVVELFHHADSSPAVLRGAQQLLGVVCELAADFHSNRQRRQLRQREQERQQLDQFIFRVLRNLDVDQVAYAISNEGRRLVGCDRVTVLTCGETACTVRSVSGLDTIDRRSATIRLIERLAARVVADGNALWFDPRSPDEDAAQGAAAAYLKETGAQLLGVVPLKLVASSSSEEPADQIVGALVVEVFEEPSADGTIPQRAAWVAAHSAAALHSAVSVAEMPLLRLSRLIAASRPLLSKRRLPIMSLVALAIGALGLLPVDFHIEAPGELQPVEQQVVYAPADGVVAALPALSRDADARQHDQLEVQPGDVVVELQNADLDYEMTTVLGEQSTARQQLDTISVTLEKLSRSTGAAERVRFDELTAQKLELDVRLHSLGERLEVLRREKESMSVRAEISGRVQTWDVVARLRSRPVRQGDKLMTIVNVGGPWRLDVYVPDHHIGYVTAARRRSDDELLVSFVRKSDPEQVSHGHIRDVALSTEVRQNQGASVLVSVAIDDPSQWKGLRPGTTVNSRVHCGRKPLGYVWLHDLIEVVRRRLWI